MACQQSNGPFEQRLMGIVSEWLVWARELMGRSRRRPAESLVTQPATTKHHGLTSEERRHRSISDTMLRLSIGLEAAEDLIQDLQQALTV